MTACPALAELEAAPAPHAEHLVVCASCRIVVELLEERRRARERRDELDECERFEMLIAARAEGTIGPSAAELLDAHLRECGACCAVSATVAPAGDRASPASLPPVSTAAYALGREIARGGMGRIFEARDVRIGRSVAVKELLGDSPLLAARFAREARVTARLQHPGIVPIYEIGTWPDGTPFYSMRMVEGRTLRQALSDRPLDERLALLPAMIAAADAVAFAHGKGIVHRDLTPNNILLGDHGDTVVIDWGLAKDLAGSPDDTAAGPYRDEPQPAADLTSAGAVLGTLAYMPPEQANGDPVDERADVYALGALLYHLLAGVPPYRATASDDLLRLVRAGAPPPIEEAAPGAPRDLVSIVAKAMAREPAERYLDAGALAAELRRFQTGRLVEAHHYSKRERLRRWVRAHRAGVIASAAAMIALVVAGALGLAGVLAERDTAERERQIAVVQTVAADAAKAKAELERASLLEEQGRQELLAGNPTRALVWLAEAYQVGNTSEELRFLLGTAISRVEAIRHTFECAGKVQSLAFSSDGVHLLAACSFGIVLARTADWQIVTAIKTRSDGATLSPRGGLIASKQWGTLTVFAAASGAEVFRRRFFEGQLRTMAFTPDERLLITTGDDGKIRFWDTATGEVRRTVDASSGAMNVVRGHLAPDGRTLYAFTADGLVRRWDVARGKPLGELRLPHQPVLGERQADAISPDGKHVVTCGTDGSVHVTDLATGAQLATFVAHAQASMTCAFAADGRRVVTAGLDGSARVWDVATKRLVATLPHGGWRVGGVISRDGQQVVTMGADGSIRLWHAATGSLLASLDDPFATNDGLALSPDGRTIVAVREPATIVVMRDLAGPLVPRALPPGAMITSVSPSGRHYVVEQGTTTTIVDAETLAPLAHEPLRSSTAWSGDGARHAALAANGDAIVVDLATGATLMRVVAPDASNGLALDAHGRRLLVGSARAEVWDVDRGARLLALGKTSDKDGLSPDGKRVVAWSDPHAIEIWDVDGGRVLATIPQAEPTLGPAGFDPAGGRVALVERQVEATGGFHAVRIGIYDAGTGRLLSASSGTHFATIDPSRRFLVESGVNKQVDVRRLSDGALVRSISPGVSYVMRAEAVRDAAFVIAEDGASLALRSAVDGRKLAELTPTVRGPTFTQDGVNMWTHDRVITSDGRIVLTGPSPIVWTLPRETRSPADVARIVRERVRWKLVDGRLLPVSATLRGRVIRDGRPVARATVAIGALVRASWLTTVTDDAGNFELRALRSGRYDVVAVAPGRDAFGERPVIIDGETATTEIVLDNVATIAGVVVDEAGRPAAGARVRASHGHQTEGQPEAITDAEGRFTLRALRPGDHEVDVLVTPGGKRSGYVALPGSGARVTVRGKRDALSGVRLVVGRE